MSLPDLTDQFVADTYIGVLHTSNIPTIGSSIPQVYDGLGNKTALKLGREGNGASVSGCLSADCVTIGGVSLVDFFYPVGSVMLTIDNNNPSLRFLGTNWVVVSQGRFLAGVGTGIDKNSTNATVTVGNDPSVGEYSHVLSVSEMPSHTHDIRNGRGGDSTNPIRDNNGFAGENGFSGYGNFNDVIGRTGGNQAHNNIPPYFGIYVWQRIF
jgi:microcystin-dependent protein